MKLVSIIPAFLASLGIWIVCLIEVLNGNELEPFRLGNVITPKSTLGYTYLDVLVTDTAVFLALGLFAFIELRRYFEELALIRKYGGNQKFARFLNLRAGPESNRHGEGNSFNDIHDMD